jgi:aspartate-semialdehyde dehydrogenase
MKSKYPIGILGATGAVGQRYIQLLEHHPWFEVAWLAASDRSSGKPYADAAKWRLDTPLPERIARMIVSPAEPPSPSSSAPKIIFSSVDAPIARELEPAFANAGCAVVSNSSAYRMTVNVPLVIPEINADHLHLIEEQPSRRDSGGYIVTNPNCSTIGLVIALKPLEERFGIEQIFVTTMQAVSGAGYPGVASMDILGNVVPYIGSEEEKMESETLKLLGRLESENGGHSVAPLAARITAHCNRVAVEDGHMESISIKLGNKLGRPVTREDMLAAWAEFRPLAGQGLPFAPEQPIEYAAQPDRPQPRLDRNRGNGMTVTVGRLRPCGVLDWKFIALSHNTIRGAAGASILNAELLASLGKLEPAPPAAGDSESRDRWGEEPAAAAAATAHA